jgi:hypothetical protein
MVYNEDNELKEENPMSHNRNFFSLKRAREFAAQLTNAEDITISAFRDAFGQTQYVVKWYLD